MRTHMKNKKKILLLILLGAFLLPFLTGGIAQIVAQAYVKDSFSDWHYRYQRLKVNNKGKYEAYFESDKGDDLTLYMNSFIFPTSVVSNSMEKDYLDDIKVIGYDNGLNNLVPEFSGVPITCVSKNNTYTNMKITTQAGELVTLEDGNIVSHGNEYKGPISQVVYWKGGHFDGAIPVTVYGVKEEDKNYDGAITLNLTMENAKDESGIRLNGCDAYSNTLETPTIVKGEK